jgi:ribosomal protein S17E
MQITGRKVAVVGMGGAFPTCSNLDDFSNKLFSNQSLIREWDKAVVYNKQLRSTVAGYITEEEMGLEAIIAPIAEGYPETYIDKLGRIPDGGVDCKRNPV